MPIRIGARPDHGFDEPLGLLSDCHRRIEHFLHVLTVVTERAAGGPLSDAQRIDLNAALNYFAEAAPKHTADEEQSLFPRLRQSKDPAVESALETVERLERDHTAANAHHAAVDTLVRRWLEQNRLDAPHAQELRDRLAALHGIYEEHIGVEDRELFPAAAKLLTDTQIHDIGREMAARRTPTAALPLKR